MADGAIEYDPRWHKEIGEKVAEHDHTLRGGDDPGLIERVRTVEGILAKADQIAKEERDERRANRFQVRLAAFVGVCSLVGLLIMAVLDHTVWKPMPIYMGTTSTTTLTDTGSRTTTLNTKQGTATPDTAKPR